MSFSSINDDQCTSEAHMSASDKNPAIIWRKHNKVFLDPAAKHIPAPHGTLVVDLLDQRNSPPACCSTVLISKVLQFLPQPRAFLRKVITPSKYCNFEHNTIFSTRIVGTDTRMSKVILESGKTKTAKNSRLCVAFRMFFQKFCKPIG